MVDINPGISVITLKISVLKEPVKRLIVRVDQKIRPNYMLLRRNSVFM